MRKLAILLLFTLIILSQLVKAQELSITPNMINETTTKKTFEKILNFENFGDSDIIIERIEISEEIRRIVFLINVSPFIPSNDKTTMTIRFDTTNLTEGSYRGVIEVLVNNTSNPIYVDLNVISSEEPLGDIFETIFPIGEMQDHTYIIWYFTIGIIILIIIITILKYRKRRKKKKEKKEEKEGEMEEVYYRSQEEYRTEYY
ncbi:MAG: hypothetical protein GTN40_02545 [Candidatus Aenigmarchaeota archaeon]|nr:hypothetical protein [Candidatus Aenigmarchaeota archaeon]